MEAHKLDNQPHFMILCITACDIQNISHFSDDTEVVVFTFRLFKMTNIDMVSFVVNIPISETSSKNVQRNWSNENFLLL